MNMVFRLLARDAKGTLKASRIVQLRKVAQDTGDERFLEACASSRKATSRR